MLKRFNLQNSFDKVKFLTIIQTVLVLIAFISEALFTQSVLNFSFIFQLILLIAGFNFYYNALSGLYYSFWNISFILIAYYTVSLSRNFLVIGHPFVGFLYFLSFIILLICCYIISSPLYYPLVNWWEYDFRFRADIRCWVEVDGQLHRGRLSDLRRGAACLELFQSIPVGQPVQINVEILNQKFTLFSEVRSRREPIMGRSIVYGIKFINNDLEHNQRLRLLTNYWKESKKIKIRNKFSTQK